jgi:hypothetical protein
MAGSIGNVLWNLRGIGSSFGTDPELRNVESSKILVVSRNRFQQTMLGCRNGAS